MSNKKRVTVRPQQDPVKRSSGNKTVKSTPKKTATKKSS